MNWQTSTSEQDRVEGARRLLEHAGEAPGAAPALLLELDGPDAAHLRERGLARARAPRRSRRARTPRRAGPSRRRSPRDLRSGDGWAGLRHRGPGTWRGAPVRDPACARSRRARRGRSSSGAAPRGRRGARARRRGCRRGWAPVAAATDGHSTTSPSTTGGSPSSAGAPGPRPPESGWRPPGTWSSSIGNDSTSVGPVPPRKRTLRSVIAASSTKISDTSASTGARSSASTMRARPSQRSRSTATSLCSSDANTDIATAPRSSVPRYGRRR